MAGLRQIPSLAVTGRNPISMAIAAAALIVIGMRVQIGQGLTIGLIVSIALIPCWWPSMRRFRGARCFLIAGLGVVFFQVWLTELASVDHTPSVGLLANNLTLIGALIFGVPVILWAREHLSVSWVAVLFGLGMLADAIGGSRSSLFASNPWKFGFSTPITIIALAIALHLGKRWLEIAMLLIVLAAAALTDGRSSFGILALALVLTAVQLRPDGRTRRGSIVRLVIGITGLGLIVFNVGQSLILSGYLGDAAQSRSIEQIDASGSLILGGRPELAATIALMQHRPIGYGAGTLPNLSDVLVAKSGMADIGYQPNNGYVENYLFGNQIELHSVLADLWVKAGVMGIVFVILLVLLTMRSVSALLAKNSASSLVLYLMSWLLWNILFSPLYASILLTMLLIGLVLPHRAAVESPRAPVARNNSSSV